MGGDSSIGYDESWYFSTAKGLENHPQLDQSISTDVCVIGAGYTGLSAAIELAERGFKVVVLESHKVGAGASGRNGGVLGMGQRKDQDELEDLLGIDTARKMWQIASDANSLVRNRITRYKIDCDLQNGELHAAHKEKYVQSMWDYNEKLLTDYDYSSRENVSREEMSDMLGMDTYFGGSLDSQSAHIHPLNLVLGLARAATDLGVKIYENSAVEKYDNPTVDSVRVTTKIAQVNAKFLILACNAYLGKLDKKAGKYQMPINNFVLATESMDEALARKINRDNVAVVDSRFVVNYFHNSPDNRLIFGGGENYSPFFPRDIKSFVRNHMLDIYPDLADLKIDYAWGGTLAITMRRMPQFGRQGKNIYWAQGYSGHGIAMANMGGKLVAEAIAGQAERFDLFANIRHFPFPGGAYLRWPGLVAGMLYYAMLDKF